jgi:hypothetical protein
MDKSLFFQIINPVTWEDIQNDPYEQYSDAKYVFFSDGYFWFPKDNPNKADFECYFKDDLNLMKPV